jgi:hypothetical protein
MVFSSLWIEKASVSSTREQRRARWGEATRKEKGGRRKRNGPVNGSLLVGLSVRVRLDGAGLATEDTVESGSN